MEAQSSAASRKVVTESAWAPASLPAVPLEMKEYFIAHSVTAAHSLNALLTPSLSWTDLQSAPPQLEIKTDLTGSRIDDADILVAAGSALLPKLWGPPAPGKALVFLGCGTVALVDPTTLPQFAGFVTSTVATREAVPYRLPIHRLSAGASSGRTFLLDAEARLLAFERKNPEQRLHARQALALISQAGYPNPGTPSSNADVTALWRRHSDNVELPDEWLGLVHCHAFGGISGRMGVLVRFAAPVNEVLPFESMKMIADTGRDRYRHDLLSPCIEHVHVFPVDGDEKQ